MKKLSGARSAFLFLFACLAVIGCGEESFTTIDVSEAEFSSEESYARYDQETAELSAGQEP